MQTSLGRKLRVLRAERGLTLREAASRTGVAKETISDIERGLRHPHDVTLSKLARGYEVSVVDLLEEAVRAGKLEDSRSLEELHDETGSETDWLIMPEEKWIAAWPPSLTPEEAMRIVRELDREFSRLEPLIAKQEQGLPVARRMFNGRYGQAWRRFFSGQQAAHECGVVHRIIERDETLKDLAERLEEKPTESFEKTESFKKYQLAS
jgi:transcriptional regulator with XRE-family HTH domain